MRRGIYLGKHVRGEAWMKGVASKRRMSKKKQQKNGFFYYMLDMQEEFRQQGRTVPMRDMPIFAGPSWSKLSDAQKQCYNQRAKAQRARERGTSMPEASAVTAEAMRPGRRDCLGNLVSERCDTEAEKRERNEKECHQIRSMLPPGKRVILESFFFIDIQSICHIPQKPDNKYLPCEVAVVRYCLSEGVLKKFHSFIKPGPIPIGYRYLAQTTSEATHQIPVEGSPDADRDYRQLLGKLESFLTQDDQESLPPPVFAKSESVECVQWSLQWLADRAGVSNRINHVYKVESLISELVSHIGSKHEISSFEVDELLKTSSYDHDSNTRCEFHETVESIHCSLGISHIYCYVISELLCPLYHVSLTRNHLSVIPSANIVSSKRRVNARLSHATPSIADSSRGLVSNESHEVRQEVHGRGRGLGRGIASYELPRQPQALGRGQLNYNV